jgi:hypothetical protein
MSYIKNMNLNSMLHEFYNGKVYLKQIINVLYTTKCINEFFDHTIILAAHSAFK